MDLSSTGVCSRDKNLLYHYAAKSKTYATDENSTGHGAQTIKSTWVG